jgi:hypothetical protein
MGTTLAFIGAYNLAGCLQQCLKQDPIDPTAAFAQYEATMRPIVENAQKLAPGQPRLVNPETAWGILTMRWLVYMLSYTRVILIAIVLFGKLLHLGPQAANGVPVEDYGFMNVPEWKDDEAITDN